MNDSSGAAADVFPETGFSRESLSQKRLPDPFFHPAVRKRGICNGLPVLASKKAAGLQFHSIGNDPPDLGLNTPL
jgi:hypothetical protein